MALIPPTTSDGAVTLEAILDRVRRLEVKTHRLVDSLFAGNYRSAFKGRGLEFRDVREYDTNDDVRLIDWNVTARTGVPHVRQYEEERELTIVVCLDVSASSAFGTTRGFKRELAVEFAACLGLSAARSNDRFGAVYFSGAVDGFVPPRKGHRHVLRILRDGLAARPTAPGTDLAQVLRFCTDAFRRRCVLFIVSDLMAEGFEAAMRVAAARHEVIAVEAHDPRESALPDVGLVELADPETGRTVLVDSGDPAVRADFEAASALARQRRLSRVRSCGVEVVSISTDQDMLAPLMRFFRSRQRRVR